MREVVRGEVERLEGEHCGLRYCGDRLVCGEQEGRSSFIGQRHYTGLSGEIHGRYGHGTDAYPRENCIAPDTHTLYSMTIRVSA